MQLIHLRSLAICLLLPLLIGCGSDRKTSNDLSQADRVPVELQPLYDEIMSAHDEVMPRMSELTKLQGDVVVVLDTLRSQSPVRAAQLKEANRILGKLNQAENAMWDWMHGFGKLDSIPDADKEIFLQSEKSTVTSMRELMLTSMEDAKTYLDTQQIVK